MLEIESSVGNFVMVEESNENVTELESVQLHVACRVSETLASALYWKQKACVIYHPLAKKIIAII